MPQESSIGLAELIAKVKQELLSPQAEGQGAAPLLSIDEITLEIKVTVEKKAEGGLHIHVVELGGGVGREDVQTVTVTLTPLVSKEERLLLFKELNPKGWAATRITSIGALDKGSDESPFG